LPEGVVGLLSFLLTSFVFYWWHRATHKSDVLWRIFHQLHHSAKRVEALTAFYAHPLDSAAAVLISAFSSYVVLGASPLAAGLALLLTGVFDLFLHSDLATPRWLGIFVQRPEMHTVHHAYGHHAQNYGLPLWDMLFGTWVNPALRVQDLGFDEEKSQRITDMLMFRDVHKLPAQQETSP
jgi:sterol desaturase/sphingolipid hydroxylase (fatty acid hydroxylase superfamily)